MTYRQKIASLFIIVFVGVILMKPVHFLFADHHSHSITQTHTHSDGTSPSVHHDCDICLFMLQAFTPQQFAELQPHFEIYFAEIAQAEIQPLAYETILPTSLRAPPAVYSLQSTVIS